MDFCKILRTERMKMGLSQERLGALVNKSKNNISQYELGKREPDINTLLSFAKIFNCSTDYLLGYSMTSSNHTKMNESIKYDFNIFDLPDEAKKQISDFISFVKQNYNKE